MKTEEISDIDAVEFSDESPAIPFVAMCLRDQIRKARVEGVSPDVVPGNPTYDDDEAGLGVDPYADIRDSRLDKAERFFAELGTASEAVAAQATASGTPATPPAGASATPPPTTQTAE